MPPGDPVPNFIELAKMADIHVNIEAGTIAGALGKGTSCFYVPFVSRIVWCMSRDYHRYYIKRL